MISPEMLLRAQLCLRVSKALAKRRILTSALSSRPADSFACKQTNRATSSVRRMTKRLGVVPRSCMPWLYEIGD